MFCPRCRKSNLEVTRVEGVAFCASCLEGAGFDQGQPLSDVVANVPPAEGVPMPTFAEAATPVYVTAETLKKHAKKTDD